MIRRTAAAALLLGLGVVAIASCGPGATPTAVVTTPACSGSPCITDSPVPTPDTFPSDFPVYPGARLTTAGLTSDFPVGGRSTWGMVWETLDSIRDVKEFYTAEFSQRGWTFVVSGAPDGSFSAIFNERRNPKLGGMLGIFVVSGVTKISVAWTPA